MQQNGPDHPTQAGGRVKVSEASDHYHLHLVPQLKFAKQARQ